MTLTDEQRGKALDLIRADKHLGNAWAIAKATGESKREARKLIDDDFTEAAREARGWNLQKVEDSTWAVAQDTAHPSWDRANARILKAYHPAYQDRTHLELTGANGGPVEIEDRSPSLADVARILVAVGAINGSLVASAELPAARALLPQPPDD